MWEYLAIGFGIELFILGFIIGDLVGRRKMGRRLNREANEVLGLLNNSGALNDRIKLVCSTCDEPLPQHSPSCESAHRLGLTIKHIS